MPTGYFLNRIVENRWFRHSHIEEFLSLLVTNLEKITESPSDDQPVGASGTFKESVGG